MKNSDNFEYYYKAKVLKIVDGDTVDLDCDMGMYIHSTQRIRLASINAPEVRGVEREAGREAKAFLPLGSECIVYTDETGKFGRWIGTIFVGAMNVNDEMVKNGHATKYQ
jgi:micrococcal nuclease